MPNIHQSRGTKRALLVASSTYDDASLRPLPCARVDIEQLRAVLEHPGIGGFEVDLVHDLPAHELKLKIERFLGALETEDLGLLYMSGHGERLRKSTGEFLFLTRDSVCRALDGRNAVSATFLNDLLVSCSASRKVVIIDACFSGGYALGFRTSDAKGMDSEDGSLLRTSGCCVLSSSTLSQQSYDGPSLPDGRPGPSVFTGHLVESLRTGQGDRDRDGVISVDELFDDVSDRVRRSDDRQTPVKSSVMINGQFDIAKRIMGAPPDLDQLCSQVVLKRPVATQTIGAEKGQPSWPALLKYYRRCLEVSLCSFPLLSATDHKSRYVCATGPERIVTGLADEMGAVLLAADDPARELLEYDQSKSAVLHYGYPVVVLREGERTQFAPLFVQRLRTEGERMYRDGPLDINPTLREALLEKLKTDSALLHSYRPSWSARDVGDVQRQIAWVTRQLGLEFSPDLTQLAPIELGSPSTRVSNSGVYFLEPSKSPDAVDRLNKDLEQIEAQSRRIDETALGSLLRLQEEPIAQVEPQSYPKWRLCTPLPFNDAQMHVLRSAMTQKLTVTMGPPGTGKSQLVANIVASCIASEQRVLLATTNNRAVDVVCERLNDVVEDAIVRTGSQEAKKVEALQIDRLAMRAAKRKSSASNATTRALDADIEHAELNAVRRLFERAATTERELLSALVRRTDAEGALAELWDMPVDDVRARLLRSNVLRWRALIALIARMTVLARFVHFVVLVIFGLPARAHEKAFRAFAEWVAASHLVDTGRQIVASQPDDNTMRRRLQEAETGVKEKATALLDYAVEAGARAGKDALSSLISARGAARSDWRELTALLRHVRAWAVTALSARRFPLYVGRGTNVETPFDLVIVDEASQCQIVHILPVLFRAKRALIIGDPMQLGPIGELSPSQQASAREAAGLTAAWLDDMCLASHRFSVFHAAQRAARGTYLLDEHYRCHPHIAHFANSHFYQGRLVILTPSQRQSDTTRAIEWVDVQGAAIRRGSSWVNEREVDAIVAKAESLLQDEQSSIGVVSPLRPQTDLLAQRLPSDGRVKCGTVHTFQGGEQDTILMSLVLAPEMSPGTKYWLASQRNLWNVAITRARKRLIVFGDRAQWISQGGIGAMLAEAAEPTDVDASDDFRMRLHRQLRQRGVEAQLGVEIAGYEADALVMREDDQPLALIIDGGCESSDPAKHFRVQLRRTELLASSGEYHAMRLPAWRLFDDSALWLGRNVELGVKRPSKRLDGAQPNAVVGGGGAVAFRRE